MRQGPRVGLDLVVIGVVVLRAPKDPPATRWGLIILHKDYTRSHTTAATRL